MKRLWWISLAFIVLTSFAVHIWAIKNNNFYFTVDQGRDAVYVREILNSKKIFLKGPETSVRGIFTGPLWYYFISIGYLLTGGNPIGGVLILIILNLTITAILTIWLRKKIGDFYSLLVALILQTSWSFFATSLWSFNPFPLIYLSILLLILTSEFLINKKIKYFYYAAIPVALAFNTEIAGATVFLIFYLLVGVYQFLNGRKIKNSFLAGIGVFTGTNFPLITSEFIKLIQSSIIPQNAVLSILLITLVIFIGRKKLDLKRKEILFIVLTFVIFVISYFFFGSNMGWREWHTVYLPPLLTISLIILISKLSRKISLVFICIILISQSINFYQNYSNYLKPSDNPSLLSNQLKVIDWIYKSSDGNGFSVYTYTDRFYDYPYQYLFSWYGTGKYGFYPCEYSNFPNSLKIFYVPNWSAYTRPQKGCDKLRYLIIESDNNGEKNKDWIKEFRIEFRLVDEIQIGSVKIEKRAVRDFY